MVYKGTIWYNPKRDIEPVDQSGVIDLAIAMADGMIPSYSGTSVVEETEDINPSAMMPAPEDNFDRLQQSFTLRESLNRQNNNNNASS